MQKDFTLVINSYEDNKHLLKLGKRYFEVFEFRYGLTDDKMHTLVETGRYFGISPARVEQLISRVAYQCERVASTHS